MGFGETLGSAGKGAAVGSAFGGPFGAAIGGGVGLLSGLFGGDDAAEEQQRMMARQAAELERLRPLYRESGAQGLQQQLSAFGPANQMLAQMHGMPAGTGAMDLRAIGADPLPSEAFDAPPTPPSSMSMADIIALTTLGGIPIRGRGPF